MRALEQTVKDLEARVKKLEERIDVTEAPETRPELVPSGRKPTEIGGDEKRPGTKVPGDASPSKPTRLIAPLEVN